jgi:autotransporter-associated beta strand protein
MKTKPILRPFLAPICASIITVSSASAQTTYTWENSNTNPPAVALDWFAGGSNSQAAWLASNGEPVSGSANTVQFFENTTTALTGWTGTHAQSVVLNHGGSAFELGTLTLSGLGNATTNNIFIINMSGDALNFPAATGTINLNALSGAFNRRIEYNIENAIQLGTTSSGTALTITGNGTTSVFNLKGGINELQAGGGSVEKSGTSTLLLGGISNFTGGLTLSGGFVSVASNAASSGNDVLGGAGSTVSVTANTTMNYNPSGLTHTYDKKLAIASGVTFTHVKGAAGTVTFTGVLSGPNDATLVVNDAGSIDQRPLVFSNSANTFTGTVSLANNQSTVRFASIGDAAGTANIVFGTNASRNGSFQLDTSAVAPMVLANRRIEIVTGASGAGTARIENRNTTAANTLTIDTDLLVTGTGGTKTLEFRGGNTGDNTFAGDIANGGLATLNLSKQDAGKWILSGDNSYNGTTTVAAGTLLINGDHSAATGAVAVNGTSTLGGSGTIGGSVTVALGAKIAPGTSVGTLAIGGGLNISAMADGAGTLNFDLGPIAASDKITVGGGLNIGSGALGFSDFVFSNVGGLQAGTYTLITSSALTGTLNGADLVGTIGSFDATLQISGNNIVLALVAGKPTTTLVIDLGAGTQIPGDAFGTFGALNLPIPPLPVGSILRSLEVDAVLTATDNSNFASDLAILFDPTPATPGGDFSVVMTNGANKFGAPVQLGWPSAANSGPPTPLVDTKVAANWAAAGTIDLATTGIFLGNAYNENTSAPDEGGTWSGTITLTYDMESTGTPYELWAGPGVDFDADENNDGVSNGLAFLLGATSPSVDANSLLPTVSQTGGGLVLTFSMLNSANRGGATLSVEHSSDLGLGDAWTTVPVPETSGGPASGVSFSVTANGSMNNVVASIASDEADGGKLFGRLRAENP